MRTYLTDLYHKSFQLQQREAAYCYTFRMYCFQNILYLWHIVFLNELLWYDGFPNFALALEASKTSLILSQMVWEFQCLMSMWNVKLQLLVLLNAQVPLHIIDPVYFNFYHIHRCHRFNCNHMPMILPFTYIRYTYHSRNQVWREIFIQ